MSVIFLFSFGQITVRFCIKSWRKFYNWFSVFDSCLIWSHLFPSLLRCYGMARSTREVRWEKTCRGILEVEYESSSFNGFTQFVPPKKIWRICIAKYTPGNLCLTKRIKSYLKICRRDAGLCVKCLRGTGAVCGSISVALFWTHATCTVMRSHFSYHNNKELMSLLKLWVMLCTHTKQLLFCCRRLEFRKPWTVASHWNINPAHF